MEMIDVLQKLKEIQESRPGVVDDAVASVESFNPKTEGGVKAMLMDIEQDAVELSKEEFVKKHNGRHMDIWNRVQKEKEEVGESKHTKKSMAEAKPDFLDMDKDGDKKEPMKKAIKDKKTMKEEDAYGNDRFMIKAGRAIKDNSDTADKKDHVYAPDAMTAIKLHKQGKKV